MISTSLIYILLSTAMASFLKGFKNFIFRQLLFVLSGLFFLGYNYMTVAWQGNLTTTTVTLERYSIIPVTRIPDNSNSPYLELKLNPLALILLHNLPPITRTFVNSNHFHRSLGGSSYREYTVQRSLQ